MLKPLIGSIGVRIDAAPPWANGFRRALGFWNTVLAADFHEENDITTCSVRIIEGGAPTLSGAVAARAQIVSWSGFQGVIAVSHLAAKEMNNDEIYATAVHELGHILGLRHNVSRRSVMYFLDLDGTESLDRVDILELSRLHTLRPAILAQGSLPQAQSGVPSGLARDRRPPDKQAGCAVPIVEVGGINCFE